MPYKPTTLILSTIASLLLSPASLATSVGSISLIADSQSVNINPNSLAIKWNNQSINQAGLQIDGVSQQAVQLDQLSNTHFQWTLKPSNIRVDAKLASTLSLSFRLAENQTVIRDQPITLSWYNLAEEDAQELYLPFSEGMRVPTSSPEWIKYLSESRDGSNTTQDLKMPFWTAQQGSQYISWHMVTATNNSLSFNQVADKLDMRAAHQFTSLNSKQPFTVSISVGDDWLSGAKQYRQWRVNNGFSTTLAEKKQANPNIDKLIGASQVYLFGSDGISVQDVTDWWGLHSWLFKRAQLAIEKSARKELQGLVKGKDWLSHYHKQLLVDSINLALNTKFKTPAPTMVDNAIEAQFKAAQQKKQWLSIHAGQYLIDPQQWGQAISTDMVKNLKASGLTHLWLGFDNWMPAFYQPEVIKQAKQAGYLVGTYDSYNTAIPLGLNDGWLTAQLPDQVRNTCAIELADGSKKKGFRGNGYYLNPLCETEYVSKRISDILHFGQFDSLFIDVDATAMAREDYNLKTSESDMLRGFNSRMRSIADNNNVVLGSEDGNALTTSGIAFAHGLETIGFGWSDKEMKRDTHSPYYLGRWYPDHKPDFFFKPAKVKEPYKTLLFAPQYRIPLYQTVFHNEVINSHHWHSDSLKFSDVKIERDLTAMLYNVPSMVHLSRDEVLSPNSKRLVQLKHYQSGFKPLHQALWDKQLNRFEWLTENGKVQQTTFSDGSKIIANFSDKEVELAKYKLEPQSILALLEGNKTMRWKPLEAR
ncbi:glycoside hydrolase [Vibrio europaeus]|uniref:glycoside hydrolase n=1 Tax=Vibrio europaeus TaxID=300876 RepID=UPI00148C95D1|nr:glycoside hydrolase [Vibrio europaeus]NOH22310.1 glycosyl hydrolase [Vibrio europaeus]